MKSFIEYDTPDRPFWDAYAVLWNNSQGRSVFKAPHYLEYLANLYRKDFAVYKYYKGPNLMGASFFRKEGNTYHLLTDVKSDHNFFILHESCQEGELAFFFEKLFASIRNAGWALVLNNQPAWAPYMKAFLAARQKSGLFCLVEAYSKCLILEKESPEALYAELSKSKEATKKAKRLAQEPDVVFENFAGDEELEAWTEGFCKLHVQRWQDTATPSRYQTADSVLFLRGCLKAWSEDGVLIRFSIKLGAQRIAYAACLIQHNSLIRHTSTYDTQYQKHSPGKVLMLMIGEWMRDRGLNKLDFGEGDEAYKYDYTNTELELDRISISRRLNIPFILKTRYKKLYREQVKSHPGIKKLYYDKIAPLAKKAKMLAGALSTDLWQINSGLVFLRLIGAHAQHHQHLVKGAYVAQHPVLSAKFRFLGSWVYWLASLIL